MMDEMISNAIVPIDRDIAVLGGEVKRWRSQGRRVVLCHGCFDPLHFGHLLHLRAAREFGDVLVVTVTADTFVAKGPGRPIFSEQNRAEMLASLRIVDRVGISEAATAVDMLKTVLPDVYVKGIDYVNSVSEMLKGEIACALELGIEVRFTTTHKSSATKIAQRVGWLPDESA
jgi:rfaE bifunctional protein nucleotidyltransferase chain/domain